MAINLSDENFLKEIQGSAKPVLVDFYATWCEPCSVLAPILERIAEELKNDFVLAKANVDDVPMVAKDLEIDQIPTVVLFKNGKHVSGFIGVRSESDIKEWLKATLMGNPEIVPADNQQEKSEELIKVYENYAQANGFRLNPDSEAVKRIISGLLENERKHGKKYCPCRRLSGNPEEDDKKVCPCAFHKDEIAKDGNCLCRLFFRL